MQTTTSNDFKVGDLVRLNQKGIQNMQSKIMAGFDLQGIFEINNKTVGIIVSLTQGNSDAVNIKIMFLGLRHHLWVNKKYLINLNKTKATNV